MKNDKRQKPKAETAGFTLVEVVAVLVLLGILAAVAVPKFFDLSSDAEKKAAEAALMEAQVRINAGYSKAVYAGKSCEDAVEVVSSLAKIGDGGKNIINGYALTLQNGEQLKEAPGSYVTLTKSGKSFDSSTFDNLKQIFKPTCNKAADDTSSDNGLVCPGTSEPIVVSCKTTSVVCNGTVTCSCTESGEMNCNCVPGDTKHGTNDDNLKPGFDYIDKILLFKWGYKIYNPYGFWIDRGNIVDDNGKYYMAAIWNYFRPEFYKDTIEETGLVAHTASELGTGKWLIPVDTKEENWVLYKSINNQMQWMQLKNGVWEVVWGVKYGNICYDNGDVYVYSGSAGTEAPGGRNWIRMTAFSKW